MELPKISTTCWPGLPEYDHKVIGKCLQAYLAALGFSRKEITRKEKIDIHGIIGVRISILSRTINKEIKINQNLEALSTVIFGEPSSLLNAFLNLSINASHAMKTGGDLSISTDNIILDEKDCRKNLFSLQPGKFLQIEISDTGTGISLEIGTFRRIRYNRKP